MASFWVSVNLNVIFCSTVSSIFSRSGTVMLGGEDLILASCVAIPIVVPHQSISTILCEVMIIEVMVWIVALKTYVSVDSDDKMIDGDDDIT